MVVFLNSLSKLKTLEYLYLDNITIKNDKRTLFAKALGKLSKLKLLDLSNAKLDGITKILRATEKCIDLENLDLSGCHVNKAGIAYLVSNLKKYTKLNSLNLSNCLIDNDDLIEIVSSLKNHKIESLNLCENYISDHGVDALLTMSPNAIIYLYIDSSLNLISKEKAKALQNHFKSVFIQFLNNY